MKKHRISCLLWLTLSAILILADYLLKRWAETALKGNGRLILIENVLGLRYAENTGAAFSALSGATGLLSLVSLIVCVTVIVFMVIRPQRWFVQLPLSMILAGGMGNMIDRLTLGYVVDYFEFLFMKFAIFNLADVFITFGAALLVLVLLIGGDGIGRMDRS